MPVFQLILTSDTINEGRIKINNAFSATTGLWSGSSGFQSLIHNNGTGNIASGDYAISTGSGNTASGDVSFAQGIENLALEIGSHAEGFQTSALGFFSHAEGGSTIASGNFSHAQGALTTASGNFSHAEGVSTSASGFSSHAEGSGTIASGDYSHAEGSGTIASGDYSHAEGRDTIASGITSHAQGNGTIASGSSSHAEGFFTTASGDRSHAEGSFTIASGIVSHAEGSITTASGTASHAQGSNTTASGTASHAQGERTVASGDYSFAGGRGRFSLFGSEPILAEGETSFAFYHQDAATFPNFGARADYSAILGGRSHFIDSSSESSVILGGEFNTINNSQVSAIISSASSNITNSVGSIIINSSSAIIDGSGTIIGGGGSIDGTSSGALVQTNGFIINGSALSMIENSFGSVGGVCTINNSFYCKISGRNQVGGTTRNEINDSENSAIYNSSNCRVNYGDRTFVVASRGVSSQTGMTTGDKDCLILGNGGGTPAPGNKTIRLQATQGRGYFNGSTVSSGADYAEFFEWKDGNTNNEKRYGYFVSLNEDKIEIGNYNLIGIVSSNPSAIGDSAYFKWKNSFVTDEWGNNEYVNYKKYKINAEEENFTGETSSNNNIENYIEIYFDEKNNVYSVLPGLGDILGVLYTGDTTEKIYIEDVSYPKLNPLYDPGQTYIPREERPEWSPVGLLGKLHVRTAESITGSTISANSDGMAVNGSDYHVLKQVMDFNEDKGYGVVQILFK